MDFEEFFANAFGEGSTSVSGPYAYQRNLSEGDWPALLDVPTGMGKTAAVTLAWLWKRGWRHGARSEQPDANTPRRLIWCLPMRVLVEQTEDNIRQWLKNLGVLGEVADSKVSVHLLMGGADDLKTWAEYPEEDMILIGTQDMLLSRALMRGYGMSRYQWPIHFALLHNDCLWAFDEVQLMGAGLATSAQLEAFRRGFPPAKNSRSLWLSATLNPDWLATVDMKPHMDSLTPLGIGERDREQAGDRLRATKTLAKADIALGKNTSNKAGMNAYLDALCEQVLQHHDERAQTLVIINRVDRAQQLFRKLQKHRDGRNDLLIHARFRAAERAEQNHRLQDKTATSDRIIVATQAIEAGVDISSKTLITELAPWASLVQRFGRCNRYGEYNDSGAKVFWIDIEDDADSKPYETDVLATARAKVSALESASSADLPKTDRARPLTAVLRRKDLLDLFNTDPDLSGFDVDVSDYIRDSGTPGVQVFWRDFKDDPNQSGPDGVPEGKPTREEICPVSMGQAKDIEKRDVWYWDALGDNRRNGQWTKLHRRPRPGTTLLMRAADGGYDKAIGFDLGLKESPVDVIPHDASTSQDSYGDDWRSKQNRSVILPAHLGHVAEQARTLCSHVDQNAHRDSVIRAGRWHDLGKLHEVFQKSMYRCHKDAQGNPQANRSQPLAKSDCQGPMRHERPFFRHELASMLGWLAQHDSEPDADLIAYLILAHHGKVRMSLRAMPTETGAAGTKRFARGVHEGDTLPALDFDGEHSASVTMQLALMEIGLGEQGASWSERALNLLDEHGPFQLAWLETLVRLADWRASAAEQKAS